MIHCAKLASIHDDIMTMPMAYNSLVGTWAARRHADKNSE
jgi:hypothetical protein